MSFKGSEAAWHSYECNFYVINIWFALRSKTLCCEIQTEFVKGVSCLALQRAEDARRERRRFSPSMH